LPDGLSGIFFARGLDRFLLICPSGRLVALARDEMSLRATVNYLYRLDPIENNDEAASADVRF